MDLAEAPPHQIIKGKDRPPALESHKFLSRLRIVNHQMRKSDFTGALKLNVLNVNLRLRQGFLKCPTSDRCQIFREKKET